MSRPLFVYSTVGIVLLVATVIGVVIGCRCGGVTEMPETRRINDLLIQTEAFGFPDSAKPTGEIAPTPAGWLTPERIHGGVGQ
jgi:hypothetical protein